MSEKRKIRRGFHCCYENLKTFFITMFTRENLEYKNKSQVLLKGVDHKM